MGVEVLNFGCRLNIAEGEAIRQAAAGAGEIVVVNSCAVTNEAVRQARQAIRRAAKQRPHARVLVTGCAAQIDPARFAAMPEVAGVLGNREKREAASYSPLPLAGGVGGGPDPRRAREGPPLTPSASGRGIAR